MGRLRRWSLLGMMLVGGISIEAADDELPQRAEKSPRIGQSFVTIGPYFINISRLNYVVSKDDGLALIFEGDGRGRLTMKDEKAEALRRWLKQSRAFTEVGPYYINLGCLDYVICGPNYLELQFRGDGQGQLLLSGTNALALKQWLDARSLGPQMQAPPREHRQPDSKGSKNS